MTLRVVGSTKDESGIQIFTISQTRPDNWVERITKLLPGEAMALYGLGWALLQSSSVGDRLGYLIALAVPCILISCAQRYRATKDPQTGQSQWTAILIANISFVLWFISLNQNTIFDDLRFFPLLTLIWISMSPLIYKGSPT